MCMSWLLRLLNCLLHTGETILLNYEFIAHRGNHLLPNGSIIIRFEGNRYLRDKYLRAKYQFLKENKRTGGNGKLMTDMIQGLPVNVEHTEFYIGDHICPAVETLKFHLKSSVRKMEMEKRLHGSQIDCNSERQERADS
jgi:hypothetical protein